MNRETRKLKAITTVVAILHFAHSNRTIRIPLSVVGVLNTLDGILSLRPRPAPLNPSFLEALNFETRQELISG